MAREAGANLSWRETCIEVDGAYASWIHAAPDAPSDRRLAYRSYLHALGREQQAADIYAQRVLSRGLRRDLTGALSWGSQDSRLGSAHRAVALSPMKPDTRWEALFAAPA